MMLRWEGFVGSKIGLRTSITIDDQEGSRERSFLWKVCIGVCDKEYWRGSEDDLRSSDRIPWSVSKRS